MDNEVVRKDLVEALENQDKVIRKNTIFTFANLAKEKGKLIEDKNFIKNVHKVITNADEEKSNLTECVCLISNMLDCEEDANKERIL